MSVKHFLVKVDMAIGEVNSYVYSCDETKEALLIDAGAFDPAIEAYVKEHGLHLAKVFATHDHADHTAGLVDYKHRFRAQIIAGTERPGGCNADLVVAEGDEIAVGNQTGRIVSTPGHTPVALSLIFPGVVFSGDALFAGSVGGTSTESSYNLQLSSIRKHLFTLPGDTVVYSGHGPATTIAIERDYNPFFNP